MGTNLGNFIAITIIAAFLVASFFMPEEGSIAFACTIYGIWILVFTIHFLRMPKKTSIFCLGLTPLSLETYRKYYFAISHPEIAATISAALNFFRAPAILWGVVCLFNELYYTGGAMIAFHFVSSGTIVKHNPYLYVSAAASNGLSFAIDEFNRLQILVLHYQMHKDLDVQ